MASKTKKKAPARSTAKKPAKAVTAKAPVKAAAKPVVASTSHAHHHAKGESCCSSNNIWTGIIALIIGAAAGYILATL